LVALAAGLAALFGVYYWAGHSQRAPLVVYCAHDQIFAETIFQDFEKRTGIPIAVRYDTEATKSLGLVELLLQEKEHPRCDVFWNNELLGTLQLADEGVFQPYQGSGFARIPAAFKDADGRWVGFAARLRLWIVNTNKLAATEAAVQQALQGDLGRVAIAKPLYGTTRTQYALLWQLWGKEKLEAWHRDWRKRNVREVDGNAAVKNLVAEGVCDLGLTDTDDYFDAKDDNKPVQMVPVRLENHATICMPNTVAIIRGTERLDDAKKLVDYLLSAECEMALAVGKSRQIPLGPVNESQLPRAVKELKHWAADGYPLKSLGDAPAASLIWLKAEYLEPQTAK
jgi:iron(III) transport system substrate-binding protein